FVSVILGLYLASLGYDTAAIGAIFTAVLVGDAAITILLTQVADRLGRRRVLLVGSGLMVLAGVAFAATDNLVVLTVAGIVGVLSPSGREVGPFSSLEQAILPQTSSDAQRTQVFATYNLVGTFAGAVGALAVGLPALFGLEPTAAHRVLLWAYAATGALLAVAFSRLSAAVEAGGGSHAGVTEGVLAGAPSPAAAKRPRFGLHRSRGVALKLAGLGALDSFGQGFVVQGLLAYWFHLRFGADVEALGTIFFGANLFSAVSFLAAAPLARRFGLLNTMVFTHLPSNFLLMLVPLMPNLELAVVVLLARQLLSQLDVPTRQSYTMAVVEPDERAAAAGVSAVARGTATAIAPVFSGAMLANPALGVPFLIAGSLKAVYDVALFFVFRKVRPPEERER
ncbi:MAG: MFS transporter, partial [Chloroflexota bacterium]